MGEDDLMINLIIPSATIVSEELQNVGKLPTVIYPINGNVVFDYLYRQYSDICNIEILCYENAYLVHEKLTNYKRITITDLSQIDDLAHTVYYGIKNAGELIINFGDTIVMDNIFEYEGDCFFYAEDYVSDKWTFFNCEKGELKDIFDKTNIVSNRKKSLFVGVFYLKDAMLFKECLEKAFCMKTSISTFYLALQLYSKKNYLTAIKTSKWFDIGHADKYYNSRLEVKAREFNHIMIDRNRGILTKFSDNKNKFIGEIQWYLKLPSDIEYIRPRIFSYSLDYNSPYVNMEYYAYHTVHELFLNADLNEHQWKQIFDRIRFICKDMQKYTVKDEKILSSLEEMYLNKTIHRLEDLKKERMFDIYFQKNIYVNNTKYISLNKVIDVLKKIIPEMLYDVKEFSIIHGDMCFANMMIDNNFTFIKLIDPRGKFGLFDIYGDFRYELAKLFHSVDGKYDYIIKDLFKLNYKDNVIQYTIQENYRAFDLFEILKNTFKDEIGTDLAKIELIEALLFLSMIPLHKESYEHQLVMLGTGLDILNRVIDITERGKNIV